MALAFEQHHAGPQIHVLMIGVGGYKYLRGGADYSAADDKWPELKQLTSPQFSVQEMYKMFLRHQNTGAWNVPLGSIDILLSTAPETRGVLSGVNTRPASMTNIGQAFRDWFERCDSHVDNVAIFYYCGHGFEKGEQYLLSEDFGGDNFNRFSGMFNFSGTRRGFFQCRAETQLFFIDACRLISPDMLTHNLNGIPTLGGDDLVTSRRCMHDLTLNGAAPNEKAYGRKGKTAIFTQALVNAFDGGAAHKVRNHWIVNTGQFTRHIAELMAQVDPDQNYDQRSYFDGSALPANLLTLLYTPKTSLIVSCAPEHAIGHAILNYTHTEYGDEQKRDIPEDTDWKLTVKAGPCELSAFFNNPEYRDLRKMEWAFPPSTQTQLDCQ